MQGANGIETDVLKTRDGILVLFHDSTLEKVTDGEGNLCDYTWDELKNVKVYGKCTTGFYDRILTFREFLEKFSAYDIHFAIELKGPDVEQETLDMVKEFGIMEKTTFSSFRYERIQRIKELDPSARVSWLVRSFEENTIESLLEIGGEELGLSADDITEERLEECRRAGLGIRAWGASTITRMKRMCDLGVDGMTVNFPDRLREYLHTL
jgi:glycerophosphoryl diester phosphodiesterase